MSAIATTGVAIAFVACGQKESAPPATDSPAAGATTDQTSTENPDAAVASADAADGIWSPEALEELCAPIAIYPDVVLGHVLSASTNPQEVLDAGNWLLEHQDLTGSALDDAASKLGFTASTKVLLQFPETLDMMCMQIDWTRQLGEAFTADQAGVLDAVQRLRLQAKDAGNLQSSAQLAVETETQADKEVIVVKPADPEVVYVPKYDPVAVYDTPPEAIPPPTTTAPAESGHSTGELITVGLLAFGAGMLVSEAMDDDWDDYYPSYGYHSMYYGPRPYYPPPPYMYHPPYGPGFYPAHAYVRPMGYPHSYNNNTIIINQNNNYWNNVERGSAPINQRGARSPITQAKPNRPELANLNREATDRARNTSAGSRDGRAGARDSGLDRQGQKGYAGARPEGKAERERLVQNAKANERDASRRDGTTADRGLASAAPGSADQKNRQGSREGSFAGPAKRDSPGAGGTADRGQQPDAARSRNAAQDRSATSHRSASRASAASSGERSATSRAPAASSSSRDGSAFDSGGRSASSEQAASKRGSASRKGGHSR
jgi:hypothetical protein